METKKIRKPDNPTVNPSQEQAAILMFGRGVDGVNRPFQQDKFGTSSTLPNASAYCQVEQLFCITSDVRGENLRLVLENPATNTKTIFIDSFSGGIFIDQVTMPRSYQETLSVRFIEVTNPAGTIVAPINRKLGSSIISTVIARQPGGGVASNGLHLSNHPTGEFELSFRGQIIIPPGHNILIAVNLSSANIGILSTTLTW
ncbi:MAG: hypothetical protein ACM3YE_10965, partial [Bacteroidota bacterium]